MENKKIEKILKESRVIAVVGLSPNPERPSNRVASFMKERGYRIIPVYPKVDEILGEKAYSSISEIPQDISIDVVDIFRRSEDVPQIVDEAIMKGAKAIWMQEGIINEEAGKKAEDAGLDVVMDRCMLKEWKRLFGGNEERI
jgi:predicted CoA-binding protein